ncbi:MAG TPA: hypothetical protein VEU28_02745, partial [Actinomycetota bacterium]|nr:hypothetical protein [Actinomycetota bacterium]
MFPGEAHATISMHKKPRHHSRGRRPGRTAFFLIAIPLLAAIAVVVAWSLDGGQNGRVARNVALAGKPVGGMDFEELTAVASQVA